MFLKSVVSRLTVAIGLFIFVMIYLLNEMRNYELYNILLEMQKSRLNKNNQWLESLSTPGDWFIYAWELLFLLMIVSMTYYFISFILSEKITVPPIYLKSKKDFNGFSLTYSIGFIRLPLIFLTFLGKAPFYIIIIICLVLFFTLFIQIGPKRKKNHIILFICIQVVLTVVIAFHSVLDQGEYIISILVSNPKLTLKALLYSYSLVGSFVCYLIILITILNLDYKSASLAKENIIILKYDNRQYPLLHPFNNFKLGFNMIETMVKNRCETPLSVRKREKAELIKSRNKVNFYFAIVFILLNIVSTYFCYLNFVNAPHYDLFLICLLIITVVRLLSRSIEIFIAFYNDIISDKKKTSLLSGEERLKLAIVSLLEITILATAVDISYKLFLGKEYISSLAVYLKFLPTRFMEHLATQVFNFSFTAENDLFINILHTVQLVTGVCLILLAIGSYLGLKKVNSEYEVASRDGQISLIEVVYFYRKNDVLTEENIVDKNINTSKWAYFWRSGNMSREEYINRVNAYNQWKEWKEENDKIQRDWQEHYNSWNPVRHLVLNIYIILQLFIRKH